MINHLSENLMKAMRILFIGNFLKPAHGSASVSGELAKRMAAKNHMVYAVSKISNRFYRLIDMFSYTLVKANKVDLAVVDVFSGNAFIWSAITGNLLFILKIPFILILRGGNLPEYSSRHRTMVISLLHKAKFVVAPSLYLFTKLLSYREDIHIIGNPIDLVQYKNRVVENPRPKLLWLRAIHKIYNPCLAVKVVYKLHEEFSNLQLEMVGPDKKDGSLEEINTLAGNLGIKEFVQILGAVEKTRVPSIIIENDIFLNTTNFDNTPVSVLEAMACGLCIVSTNVGGIPYLLEHEVDALLVPPEDPPAMAAAVRRILTEPGLAARLSQNARYKAEQFDWSLILPRWEALFEEAVGA